MAVQDERRAQDYFFVGISADADGSQELVAAVTGRRIRVVDFHLNSVAAASAEGVITLLSAATTLATFNMGSGETTINHCGPVPLVQTAVGEALNLSNGVGVDAKGCLTYVITS